MKYLACLPSRAALLLYGALLAGCQAPLGQLQRLAAEHGRQVESLASAPFVLTYSAPAIRPGPVLRVYLEGDGHAWATRSPACTWPALVSFSRQPPAIPRYGQAGAMDRKPSTASTRR